MRSPPVWQKNRFILVDWRDFGVRIDQKAHGTPAKAIRAWKNYDEHGIPEHLFCKR
jgi:hypothetical protein